MSKLWLGPTGKLQMCGDKLLYAAAAPQVCSGGIPDELWVTLAGVQLIPFGCSDCLSLNALFVLTRTSLVGDCCTARAEYYLAIDPPLCIGTEWIRAAVVWDKTNQTREIVVEVDELNFMGNSISWSESAEWTDGTCIINRVLPIVPNSSPYCDFSASTATVVNGT